MKANIQVEKDWREPAFLLFLFHPEWEIDFDWIA